MQPSDVKAYGRDYSAREFTDEEFRRYMRENPSERPVSFLGRYIGYPGNPKCISHYPGKYLHHRNAGRPIFLFHQIGYDDMAGGYDRGRGHAQVALADAKRVGWEGESHIVACMDRFYVKPGYVTMTREGTREYMRGFRSVLGDRAGYYGFYDSMAHAVSEGWASFYVQCGARSAHVKGIHSWQENNYQPKIFGTATDILELYCSWEYAFGGTMSTPKELWEHGGSVWVGSSPEKDKDGNSVWWSTMQNALLSLWGNTFNPLPNQPSLALIVQMLQSSQVREVAMLAAMETIAKNPLVTKDELQAMMNNAVKAHVQITGTVNIGPAPVVPKTTLGSTDEVKE